MTKVETTCPVAALADEAEKLIRAHNVITSPSKERDDAGRERADKLDLAVCNFLDGVLDRATYVSAQSGRGALFQLGIIATLATELAELVNAADAEGNPILGEESLKKTDRVTEKINRLIYSLAATIVDRMGGRLDDAARDYFLPPWLDDHDKVSEALALAERSKAA